VDQFRQSIENERANLLQIHNSYELSLDYYKTGTLGLPPDLPIELDDSLIRQFQLVASEATQLEEAIVALQDRVGALTDFEGTLRTDVDIAAIRQILTDASQLVGPIQRQLDNIQPDLKRMEQQVPVREQAMTDKQKQEFQRDRQRLHDELAQMKDKFEQAKPQLTALQEELAEDSMEATLDGSVVWFRVLLRIVQDSMLVQARARLETVSVQTITLDPREAYATALSQRMDFMNGRAALVDRWRGIQVSADALQSQLTLTTSGELGTARNNPLSFRDSRGNLRMGLEFDTPFRRLVERNNYRQSLIDYQRSRREFIRSHDSLHLGLRGLLRQIVQLRTDLEIQRRAVAIAIRRVDLTRAAFYAPVRPPQPGQRPAQFGPTAAQNLLTALAALRNTQNNFMGVWLNYYAARMRLARELGTMKLDEDGGWRDDPVPDARLTDASNGDTSSLPPALPTEWIELTDRLAQAPDTPTPTAVETVYGPIDVDSPPAELVKETDRAD